MSRADRNPAQDDTGRRHGPGFSWRPRIRTVKMQTQPCPPRDIERHTRTIALSPSIEQHRTLWQANPADIARYAVKRDRRADFEQFLRDYRRKTA